MGTWVLRRSFRMLRRIGERACWVIPCPLCSYLQEPPSHGLLPGFTFTTGDWGCRLVGGLFGGVRRGMWRGVGQYEERDDVDTMGRSTPGMEWKKNSRGDERVSRRHAGQCILLSLPAVHYSITLPARQPITHRLRKLTDV